MVVAQPPTTTLVLDDPQVVVREIDPILLDYHDVARVLAVSEQSVRRLVADGRLPMLKLGKAVRFRLSDVQAFVDAEAAS